MSMNHQMFSPIIASCSISIIQTVRLGITHIAEDSKKSIAFSFAHSVVQNESLGLLVWIKGPLRILADTYSLDTYNRRKRIDLRDFPWMGSDIEFKRDCCGIWSNSTFTSPAASPVCGVAYCSRRAALSTAAKVTNNPCSPWALPQF